MLIFPVGHFSNNGGGGGGGNPVFLDDVINSVCFDLDATIAASYDDGVDSQKWFNLISSPADGESQSAYDFYRGVDGSASTDDPTHNGTVGNDAAYWTLDGGDFFKPVSGANTTLLGDLHKTTGGKDFWIAIAWFQTDTTWVHANLFTTRTSGATGKKGIEFFATASELVHMAQRGGVATPYIYSGVTSPKDGSHIAIVTHSHSTNKTRIYLDETTTSEQAHTFNTITTASGLATIGAYANGADAMGTETRLYSIALGNEYISDTEVANIIAHLENRHNRDYTP